MHFWNKQTKREKKTVQTLELAQMWIDFWLASHPFIFILKMNFERQISMWRRIMAFFFRVVAFQTRKCVEFSIYMHIHIQRENEKTKKKEIERQKHFRCNIKLLSFVTSYILNYGCNNSNISLTLSACYYLPSWYYFTSHVSLINVIDIKR